MKTTCIILGCLAAGTGALAYWSGPTKRAETVLENKVGQVFGQADAKPEAVGLLRVASWDDELKTGKAFEVRKSGDAWTIPSHNNYPADGSDGRVGKVAGKVIGLQRGRFVTKDPKTFKDLGLIDPLDEGGERESKGRGKRVTVKDASGSTMVDLIIGDRAKDGDGTYVREAEGDRRNEVYTVRNLRVDISTRFSDWVETDLLKVKKDDLRAISIRDYAIDEQAGSVVPKATVDLSRKDASADWGVAQSPAPDLGLSKDTVDKLVTELTSLKLNNIKPFGLKMLQYTGFYPSQAAQLMSNPQVTTVTDTQNRKFALFGTQGELAVTTKDGLRYQIFFGRAAVDEDKDLKEDSPEPKPGAEKKDGDKKDDKKKDAVNRYLAVFVQYDPKADESVAKEEKKDDKKDGDKKDEKKPDDSRSQANKAKAEKAQARFQRFFYVIANSSFEALRPAQDKLFTKLPMAGKTGKTNKQWLADNGKRPGVTTTASGLQYEIISKGSGRQPNDSDTVECNYKGTLVDGEEFDASKGTPASFGVTGVIAGWTEALKLMHEGDKWRLFIPPEIGYKTAGSPPKIGPDAILIFEIELVNIPTSKEPKPQPKAEVKPDAKPPGEAKPVEPAKPAEPAKPVDAPKPAEPAKAPEPAPAK